MIYLFNERHYDALRYTRQIKRDANALTAIIGRRRCPHPQTRLRLVVGLVPPSHCDRWKNNFPSWSRM